MVSLVTVLFVVLLAVNFESYAAGEKEKILTRKKRYLTFPEGSSLQLVYDQIIGLVDYTNLFIVGVTCALAWPLPEKPYDENLLMEQFQNEGSTTEERIGNTTEVPPAPVIEDVDPNYNITRTDSAYNDWDSYLSQEIQSNALYDAPWDDTKRKDFTLERIDYVRPTAKPIRHHLLYSAIGKRSIPAASKIDRFYLNHHRTTRHSLYKTIEKYMDARGKNGTDCVRKALCETRKKERDGTPSSLVAEIMRVIFSLPPTNEDTKHSPLSRQYDEAFNTREDCHIMYPHCNDSLWTADFIF